jgi:hypothetical protein
MELRDALRLGRDAFRENSEVVADQFARLGTEAERRLARLGMLDSFEQAMSRKGRTHDVTQLFESPRVQQILRTVIPESQSAGATFANRGERFGAFLQNEKRMISTRDQTLGNSKTAERLSDDAAFDGLQSMMDAARQSLQNPSTSNIAIRAVEATINRLFGMRADTAAAVARRLYTASPAERDAVLRSLEQRLGPTRAAHLQRLLQEYQGLLSGVGAAGAARTE